MNRLLKTSLYATPLTLLLTSSAVFAAPDIIITCEDDDCVTDPAGQALFNESNLVPGVTVNKTMQVNNENNKPCDFTLTATNKTADSVNLADVLWVAIQENGTDKYGVGSGNEATDDKTITNLLNASNPISLGSIAAGNDTNYEWLVTFDPDANNDWQDTQTTFDFDIVYSCEENGEVAGDGTEDKDQGPDPTPSTAPTSSSSPPTFSPIGGIVAGAQDTNSSSKGMIKGIMNRFPAAGEKGQSIIKQKDWNPAQVIILLILAAITTLGLTKYALKKR